MSAFAVVGALFPRTRTGVGQDIQTSLASQSVLLQIGELTSYPGAPAPAMGARDCIGVSALERYYECADGWIAIACAAAPRAAALFDALGLPARDGEEALAAPRDGELASLIADVLRPLSVDDALTRLGAAGAPAAPVLTVDDDVHGRIPRGEPLLRHVCRSGLRPCEGHRRLRPVRAHEHGVSTPATDPRPTQRRCAARLRCLSTRASIPCSDRGLSSRRRRRNTDCLRAWRDARDVAEEGAERVAERVRHGPVMERRRVGSALAPAGLPGTGSTTSFASRPDHAAASCIHSCTRCHVIPAPVGDARRGARRVQERFEHPLHVVDVDG